MPAVQLLACAIIAPHLPWRAPVAYHGGTLPLTCQCANSDADADEFLDRTSIGTVHRLPMPLSSALREFLAKQSLGFGGAPLGNLYHAISDEAATALVRHAWRTGVRYFDTAPHYGNGLSEQRMGAALRDMPRDSFVLSTKVGRLLHREPGAPAAQHGYVDLPPLVQSHDYSRDGVLRSLADSRERLGLPRIDMVYVHDLDRQTHGDEFARHFRALLESGLPALAELKSAGVIDGYGIGVNGVDICMQTLRHADLDVILLAGRYTLADQSALPELLPECVRRAVTVILGGPFNSGILATGTRLPDRSPPFFDYAPATAPVIAHVAAIEETCREFGVPLPAAALQFSAAHPAIVVVLAGARTSEEFDANVAMMRLPIPTDLWTALRTRGLIASGAPLPAGGTA
jgi:D-threo-aldose 1-dehydrogenase